MTGFGIGASVKRREDVRLLRGDGRFADDFNAQGQAYAAFVRSPHAHADVLGIDSAAARAVAGVVDVITGRDLVAGGVGPIPTLIAERGGGIRNRDGSPFADPTWYPIAIDRVRHAGEPLAVVIAETAAAAEDGAAAVTVRYAARPAVVDGAAALGEGAPQLHDGVARNRVYDWECGDAEATARAIAGAAHLTRLAVVDNRLVTCFLEPRAALAAWDAAAGRYVLHASLQSVHALAANLARILGVPTEGVRCITGDVGGGFGSKIQPYPEYAVLAWAARRIGRALKWVSSRAEGFLSDAQSRDHALSGELALDADGRIVALRVHSISNVGAYVAPCIPVSTLSNMERMISGLYAIPAIHLSVEGVLTNTIPINVYRGVGRIECVYTVERLIERAARETGRDRAALRRANLMREFPYRSATGAVYDSGDYVARLDEAMALSDAAGFPARRAESERRGKLRGLGIGPYVEGTGGVPQEFAEVRVLPTGTIEVPIGSQSQGQGHETVFAQVVADRLGVPFERVGVVMGDTDRVSRGIGTFASRSMVRAGNACAEATDAVIAKGTVMAAHLLEAAATDVEYRDGSFRVVGTDRTIGLFDVARSAADGALPPALGTTLGAATMHENPAFAFANGCQVCEVEVDPETGAVSIAALSVVDDSGRSVNPMIVHGQQHGAVAQGIGQALLEACVYGADGQLLTGSFMDYAIPRAADLPSFAVESRDVPSPTNALGVKGAGEGGTVGAPGAVIHAILDALAPLGVTHLDMPATPERVWWAVERARSRSRSDWRTPMAGIDVKYRTRDNETFDGYVTAPAGGQKVPGILLITAIFGVDQEMRELADGWAADGFVVSVPDIFWRQIPGPTADMTVAFDRYGKFDPVQGMKDIEDLLNDLKARPQCNGKVAILGFCFGGRYALLGAARLGIDAAASYHGTAMGQHVDEVGKITCPVSFHYGDSDPVVPMDEVAAIQKAFAGRANADIQVYKGAGHNFAMPRKQGYDAAAARESRERVLRCFRSM